MQILPKTNPSETKVTNTGVSKPPQIGGCTVSRSSGLENNFFLLPKPFSENSHTGDSKSVRFLRFQPFMAEKTALKEKKARFDPFVPPTHFQQQVGWGTRLPIIQHHIAIWDDKNYSHCHKKMFPPLV